jgi:hypothetical protein
LNKFRRLAPFGSNGKNGIFTSSLMSAAIQTIELSAKRRLATSRRSSYLLALELLNP